MKPLIKSEVFFHIIHLETGIDNLAARSFSTMCISPTRRRVGIILLLTWLIPIACNFPTRSRQIRELSEASLRQTLTALSAEAQAEATPAPGNSEPPFSTEGTESRGGDPENPGPGARPTSAPPGSSALFFSYPAQAGDTLQAVAGRFDVSPEQITSAEYLPGTGLLPPGLVLTIPNVIGETIYPVALLPDSEVIYSPSTTDFHTHDYIYGQAGFLSSFGELVNGERTSGADIIQRVAVETSINPRLLLALLEYRSRWVLGQPAAPNVGYPLGFNVPGERGLYKEMYIAAKLLTMGYYSWRAGSLTDLTFPDGVKVRISPELNAGSVAVQYLFSRLYRQPGWYDALYGENSFLDLHQEMFGDPWERAAAVEPLFPPGLTQPELELPFSPGESWSYSGGPHLSWTSGSPRGAIDFSPATGEPICSVSRAWVTASASGLVARSSHNVVVIDLDGDGFEQTGWALVYLHVADRERVPAESWVNTDDPIGHPSCERGNSTGTHVHLARKYNGEWLEADGPLPFVLSGWRVEKGARNYEGYLVKGDERITANPGGSRISIIIR